MQSGKIPNLAITASTSWGSGHEAWRGRLNNFPAMPYDTTKSTGSWTASVKQVGQYLQVDLGVITYVTMVATQGRPYAYNQYVTMYSLAYGFNKDTFVDYKVSNTVKVNGIHSISH